MDFEKLSLDPVTIATLFPTQLIHATEPELSNAAPEKTAPPAAAPAPSNRTGDFSSGILLLLHEPISPLATDDQLNMLTRLLKAAGQEIGQTLIINMAGKPRPDYAELSQMLKPRFVLLFDVPHNLLSLPFVIPGYKVYPFGQTRYLCLPGLNTFIGTTREVVEEKKRLWIAIQQLFGLH